MRSVIFNYERAIALLRRMAKSTSRPDVARAEARELLADIDKANAEFRSQRKDAQERREKRAKGGRKGSGKFEIAPANEGGCNHGATGIVLMRKGALRLVWRSGSKYFSGIGSQSYAPADLEILVPRETVPERVTEFHARSLRGEKVTARLTGALILEHREQIDAAFGKGTAAQAAELKGTVLLPETAVKGRP